MPRTGRAVGVAIALACLPCAGSACHRKHVPVATEPELGYPVCAEGEGPDGGPSGEDGGRGDRNAIEGRGRIRAGPLSTEKNVVERFELRRTSCGHVFRSRQEWPLAISDVEVRYDADLTPIWAWKRLTIAGSQRADGNADIRRYELRTGEVFIKRRDASGELTLEKLLPGGRMAVPAGARVGAVVGPGRGVITAWLKRARLPVGGKVRELVLDFREMVEEVEMGTLERHEDEEESGFDRPVRVYTFFGRETVFADQDDVVVGDLAGMRPAASLSTQEPEPLPMYGEPDPAHTP